MAAREPVGHNPHSFLWSEPEYEPRTLLEQFQDYLPFVVMVTQGYCGKDESIHMFAADEIYWVRDVAYQDRVVCRDSHNEYYSVPLSYPEPVFPSHSNGVGGPEMSVEDMVRDGTYRFFRFERGSCHSITKNGDNYKYIELKTLEITDTYRERFLVVHTVLTGMYHEPGTLIDPRGFDNIDGVLTTFTVIPVYMPIALAIAVGKPESESENFKRTMYNFREFVNRMPKKYDDFLVQISDIMAFEEAPTGGDYEYIHFLQFIRANKDNYKISDDGYWSIADIAAMVPRPALPARDMTDTVPGKPPARPPKPGEAPNLRIRHLPEFIKIRNKKKKQKHMASKKLNKERAPSPVSDQDSDILDYEEVPMQRAAGATPDPRTSTFSPLLFTPTPLAYREGPVALELDTEEVLADLRDMLCSGFVPKSTWKPREKKEKQLPPVIPPGVPPREPVERRCEPDYGNTQPPPRPERQGSSSQKMTTQKVDQSETAKPGVVRTPVETQPTLAISESELMSKKQDLRNSSKKAAQSQQSRTDQLEKTISASTPKQRKPETNVSRGPSSAQSPPISPTSSEAVTTKSSSELQDILQKRKFKSETTIDSDVSGELADSVQKTTGIEPNINKPDTATSSSDKAASPSIPAVKLPKKQALPNLPAVRPPEKQVTSRTCTDTSPETDRTPVKNIGTNRPILPSATTGQGISNVAIIQPQPKKPSAPLPLPKPKREAREEDKPKPSTTSRPMPETFDDVIKPGKDKECISPDITDAANIPKDISQFSIQDVARSLELLNMSEYKDKFVSNQIDGPFLMSLNEELLQNEFGMNKLLTKKLVNFVEGWRPNI